MALRLLYILSAVTLLACRAGREVSSASEGEQPTYQESGPAVFTDWMHSPLRPLNGEPIAFSAQFSSDISTDKVELYVYEYELYRSKAGLPSQRQREGGQYGLMRTWDFADGPRDLSLDHVHGLGFPAHSRVEYVWRVTDVDGNVTDRFARFDAGDSPWPEDKVLLYSASRRPMTEVIDLGFFRDADYGDSLDVYRRDVEAMVTHGFLASKAFSDHRQLWAFYTTDRVADGKAISKDVTNDALIPQFLKDFSIPGIDAFCLLHREDYTDRSLLLENFHSLSNNLFSAEAHNWGTAVHECGHAIFHLSDEYGGCACFQTHNSSNVFRERADCAEWNVANGFPADDCFELSDIYERPWFSAEEPTFFRSEEQCREHNRKLGLSTDSCRTFIDVEGEQLYWAFEATCIMHDDGDDIVRPFQRACSRVIEDFYSSLRQNTIEQTLAHDEDDLPIGRSENIFGYEPVVDIAMTRQSELWELQVGEARMGVPTPTRAAGGEVRMRLSDAEGNTLSTYRLSEPGAAHVHADDADRYAVPEEGTVRVAVPAHLPIARVACEYDADAQHRTSREAYPHYQEGFLFDVAEDFRRARGETPADR